MQKQIEQEDLERVIYSFRDSMCKKVKNVFVKSPSKHSFIDRVSIEFEEIDKSKHFESIDEKIQLFEQNNQKEIEQKKNYLKAFLFMSQDLQQILEQIDENILIDLFDKIRVVFL